MAPQPLLHVTQPGGPHSLTVPDDTHSLYVDLAGGAGSWAENDPARGSASRGGRVRAKLAVQPGQQFTIMAGGFGNGGGAVANLSCGVGGGASSFSASFSANGEDWLLVAGGGGGGYQGGGQSHAGGNGGQPGQPGQGTSGGKGGSPTEPGEGGKSGSNVADPGGQDKGGNGGGQGGGSGGQGGFGGGGGAYGGGGGGSSYSRGIADDQVVFTTGFQQGDGYVLVFTSPPADFPVS